MNEFQITHGHCKEIPCDSIELATAPVFKIGDLSQSSSVQTHILRGLSSAHTSRLISSGNYLTPLPGRVYLTDTVYYIRNSYDIFENPYRALGESYASLEAMIEKKTKYGKYHNYYLDGAGGNQGMNLIAKERFDVEKTTDTTGMVFFPIIWHDDQRNYWHWHYEILPRLLILRDLLRAKVLPEHKLVYIVIGEALSSFQLASASLVLGTCIRYRLMPRGAKVPASMIIHPVTPSTFSPSVLRELRQSLLMASGALSNQKIKLFLDRTGGKNGRCISNRNDVVRVLLSHGYRYMRDPGHYNYTEQQRIFASADDIVIPHGAALANLIYCKEGVTIHELCSDSYIHPEPAILALIMGHEYNFLYSKLLLDTPQKGDYYVDPLQLEHIL